MLRGAFLPTLALGPVAVVVAALVGGGKAALGAALGFVIAIAFFALGLFVMRKLGGAADPLRFLASALAVFMGQLIFLLRRHHRPPGRDLAQRHRLRCRRPRGRAGVAGVPGGGLRPVPPACLRRTARNRAGWGLGHMTTGAHRDHTALAAVRTPPRRRRRRCSRPTPGTAASRRRACGTSSPTSSRGPAMFGAIGWGLDPWLGTSWLVAVGIVGGMALSLYLVWFRYGTQ